MGFHRATLRCGFMEHPSVHASLRRVCESEGVPFDEGEVTYYLGRETIVHTGHGPMGRIAEMLYALLQRNAVAADLHFGIPPRQVIEIGTQIDL
jgi:KUP system potassium uptake protein